MIDVETRVKFASPNAVSLLHRLGIHTYAQHEHLSDIGFDDDPARGAMRRHLPVSTEIERDDVSMLLRVLPLFEDDEPTGRPPPHARRLRPPAPGPDAAVEGRDDP